eukprot:gene17180-18909_t
MSLLLKKIYNNQKLMLSEYGEKLEGKVKKRYLEKIAGVGTGPVQIPDKKLDPECYSHHAERTAASAQLWDIKLSDEDIKLIEKDTIDQVKGGAFFLHRAGHIGASRNKPASHSDPALPSQSLIKTICYLHLYRFRSQATDHGCKHEDDAIKAYETVMRKSRKNFRASKCGHLDVTLKTTSQRKLHVSKSENLATFVHERIHPDNDNWKDQVPKLATFWRACILPEILGRWYTKKPTSIAEGEIKDGICYFRENLNDKATVSCSNDNRPVSEFHLACVLPKNVSKVPKKWYCPHCRKLPAFKVQKKKKEELPAGLMSLQLICVCNAAPFQKEKLLHCNSGNCKHGKYFRLSCLGCKRLPNNSKTTWVCSGVKLKQSRNYLPMFVKKRKCI